MDSAVTFNPAHEGLSHSNAGRTAALPWYCFAIVLGAACIPIGALWDISWHSTIGRDTFWTPAHIMIYLGGALPGMCCGWIVLKTSFFGTEAERARSVKYLGFYGPVGAWVTIWGSLTMLVSAPFDNWWHEAYGLDVEILSPPHTLLAAGMYAVAVGAMLLVLARQNQQADGVAQAGNEDKSASRLFLFAMGVLLVMASIILTEKSYPNAQRLASFYRASAFTYAFYLAVASVAARGKWGASRAAAWYMLIVGAMVWILPLFKAQPLLAPIYLQVDRMVPPVFPLILIAPALAMDWINQRFSANGFWRRWTLALGMGSAFFAVFLAVQWNFSAFLMFSEGAKNWFFAAGEQWPYFIKPGPWRDRFWAGRNDALTFAGAIIVLAIAVLSARAGIAMGGWMRRVKR